MSNKSVREQLNLLYGFRCMLTGIETKKLTMHHINKKEWNGSTSIDNGANLIREIHEWLHQLEHTDIELYYLINDCLLCYKQCLNEGRKELIEQYENEVMPIYKRILKKRGKNVWK